MNKIYQLHQNSFGLMQLLRKNASKNILESSFKTKIVIYNKINMWVLFGYTG